MKPVPRNRVLEPEKDRALEPEKDPALEPEKDPAPQPAASPRAQGVRVAPGHYVTGNGRIYEAGMRIPDDAFASPAVKERFLRRGIVEREH